MKHYQSSRTINRMKTRLELRDLRMSVSYLGHARRFLEAVQKPPSRVPRSDIEQYLLNLHKEGQYAQGGAGGDSFPPALNYPT